MGLDMRLLITRIKGDFVDLTTLPPDTSRNDRWAIGQRLYENDARGALFQRPDFRGASFLVVFDGSVLEPSVQSAHYRFVWDGEFIRSVYDFSSGEKILREELLAGTPSKEAA
jgi:hypothetical protein